MNKLKATVKVLSVCALTFTTCAASAQPATFTSGPAAMIQQNLFDCGRGSRVSAVGEITAKDGSVWTVPAATNFETATKATDLFNECGGTELNSLSELNLDDVPILDAGGNEEFIAYLFADNYFEFYINGKLLAVDPVPFTRFNSNVVRFKAQRPLTVAVMLVDWEENLGLGSEKNRGTSYHPGDGGFVAHLRDANGATVAITDNEWRAQTFYIAPLNEQACLVVDGQNRDSSACEQQGVDDATAHFAAHWQVPDDWMKPEFNDAGWPHATTFSNDTVGVDNKRAYTNFVDVFDTKDADAQFIWSSNLILDNLVLVRKTID